MINLILDILIYNYTNYLSFFFLVDLNKRKLLINIGIALIIDYLLNMYIYNVLFVIIIYITTKLIKVNMHNLLNYYLYNIFIILIYYIFSYIISKGKPCSSKLYYQNSFSFAVKHRNRGLICHSQRFQSAFHLKGEMNIFYDTGLSYLSVF